MVHEADLIYLRKKGISEEKLSEQLARYKIGFQPTDVSAPALLGDGIIQLSASEFQHAVDRYDKSAAIPIKFIPASGAATRMFKSLFLILESDGSDEKEVAERFFNNIDQFGFVDDLREQYEQNGKKPFADAIREHDIEIINILLSENGLAYGHLPKGLLKFHRYSERGRTPAEEHLEEGIAYAQKNQVLKIHFTVSPAHLEKFRTHVESAKNKHPDVKIEITFSTQKESTDTVAVDKQNNLIRVENDQILFRPAGHGALLENLAQLDADIIFIKNIDNVIPDRLKETTIKYKKALAGVLLEYQAQTFNLLKRAEGGENVAVSGKSLLEKMGCRGNFSENEVLEKLNRPIRVCGMVKNEGASGGGPFWVLSNEMESLQIVESAQIDMNAELQKSMVEQSTHFNPVDIVCGIKDFKGRKFDLRQYRDDDAGFITEKWFRGETLKAMELPGLWNGGMAFWNTIFVEVPLITFNPVKTVMDLLESNHQ